MALNKLTDRIVRQAREPGWYIDGGGLRLRVSVNPKSEVVRRSWVLRLTLPSRQVREVGLGSLEDVTLAAARSRARELRERASAGDDPRHVKALERVETAERVARDLTFKEATVAFLKVHTKSLKNKKHAAQWKTTLETYAYPTLRDLPIRTINRGMILTIVEPLWGVKTETANRVRSRIAAVLDWAGEAGYRDQQAVNPARKENFKKSLPPQSKVQKVRHHPALPIDETPGFVTRLRARGGVGARAFEFCILTVTRTTETREARWSEFAEKGVWCVPPERMKMGVAHRVPLPSRAQEILDEMTLLRDALQSEEAIQDEVADRFVFPGAKTGRPLSNMAFLMMLRKMKRKDVTTHGFRSTFRDWCAERTDFAGEVAEAALAHAVGNKVEAAYRRGDLFEKRSALMAEWALFLGVTRATKQSDAQEI